MRQLFIFFLMFLIFGCGSSVTKPLAKNVPSKDSAKKEDAKSEDKVVVYDSSYGDNSMDIDSIYENREKYAKDYGTFSAFEQFFNKVREIKQNQSKIKMYGLPETAKIIEFVELNNYSRRAIVLWMYDPKVFIGDDEMYTCPEVTTGKGYFTGITKVSLVDTKKKSIINTVNVEGGNDWEYRDTIRKNMAMEIPFSIRNPDHAGELGGLKYHATGGTKETDGKAQIIYLEDFNGDGKKLEFALYIQEGCISCNTSLFGYSPVQDKILNYDITLKVLGTNLNKDSTFTDTAYEFQTKWIDQAFCFRLDKKMELNYDVDYRGRGGSLDRYHLKYFDKDEYFSGVLNTRPQKGDDSLPYGWYTEPRKH